MRFVERPFLVTDEGSFQLKLGARIGQGSNAIVYELHGVPGVRDDELVAKMYKRDPPPGLMRLIAHGWASKLAELVREGSEGHHHLYSLPIGALHRTEAGDDIVGSAMYRASSKLLPYDLFSRGTFRYQVRMAASLSLAERVLRLHRHSMVVSDFSGTNLLFSTTGFCSIIDGDSFGLLSEDRSSVTVAPTSGTNNFLPPERHSFPDWRDNAGLLLASDVFVCTSLIVELLAAVHPFAGTLPLVEDQTRQGNVDERISWIRRSDVILPGHAAPRDAFDALPPSLRATVEEVLFDEVGSRPGIDDVVGELRQAAGELVLCGCGSHRFPMACTNPECSERPRRTLKAVPGATPIAGSAPIREAHEPSSVEPTTAPDDSGTDAVEPSEPPRPLDSPPVSVGVGIDSSPPWSNRVLKRLDGLDRTARVLIVVCLTLALLLLVAVL